MSLENHCDEIDASVFSGELLEDPAKRKMLREFAERWLRAIDARELEPETGVLYRMSENDELTEEDESDESVHGGDDMMGASG